MNSSQLIENLNRRYATKEFDPTKVIDESQLQELMEAVRLTPSSYGLQPWKFIVVQNKSLREDLLPHAYNQRQIVDASHLIVLCLKKNFWEEDVMAYIQDIAQTRNVKEEDLVGFRNMMVKVVTWMSGEQRTHRMQKQVYIALGFLLSQAAHMHLDTCPMEWIVSGEFDRVLDLEGYQTVVVCSVWYRSEDDKYANLEKVRYSAEKMIEWR